MEEAQLETSKPSEILMGFPRYRRSHLKSETFRTLVRILSHCCDESQHSGANQIHSASQELKNHDNGTDRMGPESQANECEHLKFDYTDVMDPKVPVPQKETQVFDTFEGVCVQGREFMMGVEEDEGSSGRQDMMICESESVETMSMRANGLNKGQKQIDELNQILGRTEKLVGDNNGLTPFNLELGEKQNGSSEIDLMDYQVDCVEFKQSDIKISGTESELQVEGEFNQHASEGFHASLIANISSSTKEQTSVPVISTPSIRQERQQKEMVLVKPICATVVSLPTTEEGEFKKEEVHGQKVPEANQFSVDQHTSTEALKNIKHGRQEKGMELVNTVCASMCSLPATEEGEFGKDEQHSQKVPEAMHFSVNQGMTSEAMNLSMKHERQQKEMELVKSISAAMVSLPTTGEGEFEKSKQHGQKVPEAMHFSVVQGMTSEAFDLSEHGGEKMPSLDIDILEAKHVMQQEEEQPQKISANDATTFSNNPNEEGEIEEGEISGDFGMDDILLDISSADSLMFQERKDEFQKPKNVIENIVFPFNMWNAEKEENCIPTSCMVHAPQDACNSGQVEPRTSDKNGFPSGVDIGISREVINYGDLVEHSSVLETGKIEDRDSGIQEAVDLPASLAYNQVHRGTLEEEATEDHQNASAVKKARVDGKKKRGPVTEEKKAKRKEKKRKKRAEKNRKLGVKRLKLLPVQKPKTITYCRHYLKGRCYEGDKCKFSHDAVPETKSKPCCHFSRHSCMKGDDCPFDHQLSKYPCSNFVTKGSCSRGDACMFSHQTPTKQDIPTSSKDSKPGMKPQLLLRNTKLIRPLNNNGSSASQQKRLSDSKETQSHINSEHEVADSVQKPPTPVPKGISFINVSKSPLLNPSTPKQSLVTPNKESVVKIGTLTDQSASGTAQNLGENLKKMPAVAPKGINFLSFGKGRVSSFKGSICSFFNRESGIKLSKKDNGSLELSSSSANKDDCSRVGDGTKQNVLQTAQCSNEILKNNHSVVEGMNWGFPRKASMDHSTNEVQCSLTSRQDHSLSRSVPEGVKAYPSQTSTVTSSMLSVSPFVSGQSSERLASGSHKHIFNSAQRALLSTLSFAAEHESDIKMKCPPGASGITSEVNKHISNSSS